MGWLHPELCVLTTHMTNDGLEYFSFVERANDRGDHVHQLEMLSFHVAWEQTFRIWSEFKKTAVKSTG